MNYTLQADWKKIMNNINNSDCDYKPTDRTFETQQDMLFRRQFLLGPSPFKPTENWTCYSLFHDLFLSIHPEIEVVFESKDVRFVALVGFAVDSLFPQRTMVDIVRTLINCSYSIGEIIKFTDSLAGRWLVIFQNQKGTYLFTDPCGFRQVFYYSNDHEFWCGSQPEIIKAVHALTLNSGEELLRFMMSQNFARTESAWVGNSTRYTNCFHLMPNHYLDLKKSSQVRFFPNDVIITEKTSMIVESAATILQGAIEAVARKQNVLQALTAGWDSRVLLAASRHFSQNIEYFVDRKGVLSETHPDVWVPKRLANKLNVNFTVKNSIDEPPSWFVSMLSKNVSGARALPKSRMIYAHYKTGETRININGNGSEICRNFFDKYDRVKESVIGIADLARMLGYEESSFVKREIEAWRNSLYSQGGQGMNLLDLLYWEQRLGNWGAQYPAEQDIAIDEFSPFNCRLLIETLLAAPKPLRSAPKYTLYKELIQVMWPEALSIPINPAGSPLNYLKNRIQPYIPMPIEKLLKKLRDSW